MASGQNHASLTTLFGAVGLITTSVLTVKLLGAVRIYLRPSRLNRYAHRSPNGEEPWALVTGTTNGVGLALAHELAVQGFNVVLHGRNPEKLSGVETQLREAFPARSFRTLVADAGTVSCTSCLSTRDSSVGHGSGPQPLNFENIRQQLDDIYLTVLINNVGGGPFDPGFLSLREESEFRTMENISLNALFPFQLTRALLPNLARHGPSLVMNISSMADVGNPLLATYGASKAFLMAATRAMRLEMELEGLSGDIEILGIRFGKVTDARGFTQAPSLFVPNAETMAKTALARAGWGNGVIVGHWGHALLNFASVLLSWLPGRLEEKVIIEVMRKLQLEERGTKPDKRS